MPNPLHYHDLSGYQMNSPQLEEKIYSLLECNCIKHFYREGRACYICTECKRDITLKLVMLAGIGHNYHPTHRKVDKSFMNPTGIEKLQS